MDLSSWNRFLTRDLVILPDLVGSNHRFQFEDLETTIKLPGPDKLPIKPNEGELLSYNGWREVDGKNVPLYYWVHAVDITVSLPIPISLPNGILEKAPNACEVVTPPKQEELNELAKSNQSIAERAFDRWLRVMRWKCDDSSIGRPEIRGHGSGWGTYLITSSGQRVWIWHDAFRSKRCKTITLEMWKTAESALQENLSPPVYIELMFDAIEHMKRGDFQRALVDMAVACETYLRKLVADSLPDGITKSIVEYVDNCNIRNVLTKFVPELANEEEKKALKAITSTLHQLFDNRNDALHTGRVSGVTLPECERYLEATKRLLQLRP
jgi:hypothetical protein